MSAGIPPASCAQEAAPAKINLALHVTGVREDGYHLLDSLVVFTRTADRLSIATDAADAFSLSGRFAGAVPADGANLVLLARDAFFRAFGDRVPLSIALEKALPVSSGIGGGSSDAAAALRALARLFRPGTTLEELARLGLPLGADIPMCLHARPLRARGAGERVDPVARVPALSILLVNPGVAVPTPAIFRALDRKTNAPLPDLPPTIDFASIRDWLGRTRNDLQTTAAALAPPIADALEALAQAGAAFTRMSGSGATCFGLFPSGEGAEGAAAAIRKAHPSWWLVATETLASPEGFAA